jgi:hypothetical protein
MTTGVSIQNTPRAIQLQRPGTSVNLEDLQIGFAIDEDMNNWLELYNWITQITQYSTFSELQEFQKTSDAAILILNSSYNPIIKFTFYDAFPNYVSGFDFDSTMTDTTNVLATASFSYTNFDIQRL